MELDHAAVEKEVCKEMTEEIIVSMLKILVFPGALFLFALAFFYEWVDRKFFARVQNRYGPLHTGLHGILQPIADFFKLLSKEDITPHSSDKLMFFLTPIFYFALPLTTLFVIPILGQTSLIAFEGDLIFVIFAFTLIIITVFLAGWSSMNRFGTIGSMRAVLQMLSYEIPMGLVTTGPAIAASSLSISEIVKWQSPPNFWLILLQPLGFAVFTICLLAELQLVPFDIPEAETEIVAGWRTEFTGRKLALLRLGRDLELVLASALITSLYLGGSQQFWLIPPIVIFLVKTTFAVMLLSLLRAVFARFRIDQMLSGMWKYLLPLAALQIILIQLGLGG
ncbi:MAG: NADH-quinone oxidoreductase subunit H [Candidatus Bathyarchaeota archaeon]|nr:NADH-quinone oxidoreductase subunit H [Candidatus Bathyarchaeota archaeon]